LVIEQTLSRLKRGSSFLPPKSDIQTSQNDKTNKQ